MPTLNTVFGLNGAAVAYLWARTLGLDETNTPLLAALVLSLLVAVPGHYVALRYFPEWWTNQTLRLRTRVLHGQTSNRRRGDGGAGEVVALTNETDRVIFLADHVLDLGMVLVLAVIMTLLAESLVPAVLFLGGILLSGAAAWSMRRRLTRRAEETIQARNRFAGMLAFGLDGATTVRLSGSLEPVLAHLGRLDHERSERTREEIRTKAWATGVPAVASGVLSAVAWGLYLEGAMSATAVLVAVGALESIRWFGWVAANLVASLPGGKVWMERAVALSGHTYASEKVPGVDLQRGEAPAPEHVQRHPLQELTLERLSAVHEDGTVGVRDVDLTIRKGELVLVAGAVGSGKSSLLRAVAGLVHAEGRILWNGEEVEDPSTFLRPGQVSYVAQLPRVVSGSFHENVALGHGHDTMTALETAQMTGDVASAGGLTARIGHKGTRLSGGQLQRLALARAFAPRAELLVADDVSSALDVTTELAVRAALRRDGASVLGSTSTRAALELADQVLVLEDGNAAALGRWEDLAPRWGHLAG